MFKKDTENYDVGRIDVFIRDKKAKGFVFKNIQINGFKSRSRFGNTLANLGDTNDDGFNGNLNISNIELSVKMIFINEI